MSRFLLLTLLFFSVPDVSHVFGKVHVIRRSVEYSSPTRITLKGSVSMETDEISGGHDFSDEPERRFKRAATTGDNDRLIVNMSVLPDEGHNEAIVHWSGMESLVRGYWGLICRKMWNLHLHLLEGRCYDRDCIAHCL